MEDVKLTRACAREREKFIRLIIFCDPAELNGENRTDRKTLRTRVLLYLGLIKTRIKSANRAIRINNKVAKVEWIPRQLSLALFTFARNTFAGNTLDLSARVRVKSLWKLCDERARRVLTKYPSSDTREFARLPNVS